MAQYIRMIDMRLFVSVSPKYAGPSARGLRCRTKDARLLRPWVRIRPGHGCLSVVSVVHGQVEVSASS